MKLILIFLLCVTLPICSPFKNPSSAPLIDESNLSPTLSDVSRIPPAVTNELSLPISPSKESIPPLALSDKSNQSPTQRDDLGIHEALMDKMNLSSAISDVSSLHFEWTGPTSMRLRTRDGNEDEIKLRPAREIGDITMDCLLVGYLVKDRGSSVGVLGCEDSSTTSIIIVSNYTSNTMFSLNNGNKTTVELLYSSDINTDYEDEELQSMEISEYYDNTDNKDKELQSTKRSEYSDYNTDNDEEELQRMKRSEYYYDNSYVDYDLPYDGETPIPPNVYYEFGLRYDHALFTKMNENKTATKEYITSVVTLAQTYFKKSTLGTNVHFVINEEIKYLEGKEFKINPQGPEEKLNMGDAFKIESSKPLIIFTHTNDDEIWRGVSTRREACNATRGRAIIKHREEIQRAALTMAHEMGHLYGNYHDKKEDEKNKNKPLIEQTSCFGQGIMTDHQTNRLEEWSSCSRDRLQKWYTKQGSICLKTAPPCSNTAWSSPCSCGVDANTNLCTTPHGGYCQHSTATCLVMEAELKTLCDMDCKVTNWGDWSACSKTCKHYTSSEQGTTKRNRGSIPAVNNGASCQQLGIHLEESKPCVLNQNCPRDGSWGTWRQYGQCDIDTGKKRRERSCFFKDSNMQEIFDQSKAFGGHGCVGKSEEYSICPVNCRCTAEWSEWDTCPAKCNKPNEKWKTKRRTICIPAKNNGRECTDADTTQEKDCPISRCPYIIDGFWSEWGALSDCPTECGGGLQTKKRICEHPGKDLLIRLGDYDHHKDILKDCAGQGTTVHNEKCNKQHCGMKSLTFVMDTSGFFDGSNQDQMTNGQWQIANALMDKLTEEDIIVPKYQVISSPGQTDDYWNPGNFFRYDKPQQVLPATSNSATFINQYTNRLKRYQYGTQCNLDALYFTLEHHAKNGAVIVLYTDDGTYEPDRAEVAKKIIAKVTDKQATIIIFITPYYIGDNESMMLYQRIAENRVYVMSEPQNTVNYAVRIVMRNLKMKVGGGRCIASGGPQWPIEQYGCQFPFKYEGIEYYQCTDTDHVQPWCSTRLDADFVHQEGHVGLCGDCSGVIDLVCFSYSTLKEAHRNIKDLNRAAGNKDNTAIWSGFYRFQSPAGIRMPENGNDVRENEAWIQGGHPKVNEKAQRKTICFGPQCRFQGQIRTITCPSNRGDSYHLYELQKPPPTYSYVAQEGTCPSDWVQIRTNCIYVSTDKLRWEEAKNSCIAKGGQLFEPQNEDMNDKVWKYVKLTEKMNLLTHYWVGFNDITKEGYFLSVITGDVTFLSAYWSPGSPHDDNTLNCVNVVTNTGKWTDTSCSTPLHYICQRNHYI